MFSHALRITALSASLALALGLAGCGGEPEPFLTLELNGKPLAFNAQVNANDPPAEPVVHFVTVGGKLEDQPMAPGFMFQLVHADVRPGTYRAGDSELHATYYVQNGNGSTTTYTGDGRNGSRFELTLSTMDEQHVEGSFSGLLQGHGGELMQVANGRFSAYYNRY